jgi:hypothetical protein
VPVLTKRLYAVAGVPMYTRAVVWCVLCCTSKQLADSTDNGYGRAGKLLANIKLKRLTATYTVNVIQNAIGNGVESGNLLDDLFVCVCIRC